MKKAHILLSTCSIIFSACNPSVTLDDFSEATVERSKPADAASSATAEFLTLSILKGDEGYSLEVATGLPVSQYHEWTHPNIQAGASLTLLIDGESHELVKDGESYDRHSELGMVSTFSVEKARYSNVSEELLVKLATAEEVKVKVSCENGGEHLGKLPLRRRHSIARFVQEKIDPTVPVPIKPRISA